MTMDNASLSVLVMLPLIAVLAPILATVIGRVVRIPLVVFEIVLGILFGPALLGWMTPTDTTDKLSDLGLCMLFFLAGNEIDFGKIRGRPLNRSIVGWLVALVAGVVVGVLLAPNAAAGIFIGIALTSTALGTLMPILRDAGELRTPFGTAVIALGAVGEFGPLIAISLFLSGREPGVATLILLAFVVITSIAIYLAGRGPFPRLHSLITTTLHTSGQFAIRLVLLLLLFLVALSVLLGVDMLLGAFAAGVIAKLLLSGADPHDLESVEGKLEAVGFGFLVPIFFISTGLTFDLNALVSDPRTLLLLPAFLVLLLLVRGSSALFTARGFAAPDKRAIVLLGATGLPIIVAVTNIGVSDGALPSGTAAALVGAGMLSVLLFPLIGLALHGKAPDGAPKAPDVTEEIPEEG
jgi:Kef-type K+ transport system membrane component KefB